MRVVGDYSREVVERSSGHNKDFGFYSELGREILGILCRIVTLRFWGIFPLASCGRRDYRRAWLGAVRQTRRL